MGEPNSKNLGAVGCKRQKKKEKATLPKNPEITTVFILTQIQLPIRPNVMSNREKKMSGKFQNLFCFLE